MTPSGPRERRYASAMLCFVGLGNPGSRYEWTRHNLGFWVVDRMSRAVGIRTWRRGFSSHYSEGEYAGQRVLLVKPMTYMNRSGEAATAVVAHFGLSPAQLWLIYDDLDLPAARLRLRIGGGAGGHRGVQSVIDALGSREFGRIRIGIGRPPAAMDPADYVLAPLAPADSDLLSEAADRAAQAALTIVRDGAEAAMNRFNRDPQVS